jgi:hypothetical protein
VRFTSSKISPRQIRTVLAERILEMVLDSVWLFFGCSAAWEGKNGKKGKEGKMER